MDLLQQISQNFIAFILIVSFLVFIHEFGHYYVAIKNKVKVETFSIGFGPELYHIIDRRGTRWRFAAIPLGGYVKMFGDADPASAQTDKAAVAQHTPEERAQAFYAKTVGQRAAIVFAGPGINFLFTIVALVGLYVTMGQPMTPPLVQEVMEGKPAAAAGIMAGDLITAIDDKPIERFQDIRGVMSLGLGKPVVVHVNRAGQAMSFNVTPIIQEVENSIGSSHRTGLLGIKAGGAVEYQKLGVLPAFGQALYDTGDMIKGTFIGLYQIISGQRDSKELGGVITIAKLSGNTVIENENHEVDYAKTIGAMIWFMAMLSANLGLVNLFPIPVLDGGHLMFYAAEALRGKPLSDTVQEYSLRFGLALVLTLTVFALWNDLRNFGVFDSMAKLFT